MIPDLPLIPVLYIYGVLTHEMEFSQHFLETLLCSRTTILLQDLSYPCKSTQKVGICFENLVRFRFNPEVIDVINKLTIAQLDSGQFCQNLNWGDNAPIDPSRPPGSVPYNHGDTWFGNPGFNGD